MQLVRAAVEQQCFFYCCAVHVGTSTEHTGTFSSVEGELCGIGSGAIEGWGAAQDDTPSANGLAECTGCVQAVSSQSHETPRGCEIWRCDARAKLAHVTTDVNLDITVGDIQVYH